MEIKQFKLSSGEEVICEVLEWPNTEEEEVDIVVRNVFRIVAIEQSVSGNRYYTFKPWMVFQDEADMFQLINHGHVIGEANPSEKLLEQYFIACRGETSEDSETARADIEKRLENYINNLRNIISGQAQDGNDSGDDKVIKFPGGRTIH